MRRVIRRVSSHIAIRSPCNGLIELPISSHHPMGACCSKGESPAETRELAPHPQSQPNPPVIDQPVVELPPSRPRSRQSELPPSRPRSRQSSIKHVRESPQVERTSSHQRSRARSAPQKPQREEAPPLPSERPRVKSSVASSSRNPSLDHSQTSAGERDHG